MKENFDFSNAEDQKQFENLPSKPKKILIDTAQVEAKKENDQFDEQKKERDTEKLLTIENANLKKQCEKELPLILEKYEKLLKEKISKGGNKKDMAMAYEKLGDKSKEIEIRKEIFNELIEKITQDKQEKRERDIRILKKYNSLGVLDGEVYDIEKELKYKPEFLNEKKLEESKNRLKEEIEKDNFVGEKKDYINLLQEVGKIGIENLSEIERDNFEKIKKDLEILDLDYKQGFTKLEKLETSEDEDGEKDIDKDKKEEEWVIEQGQRVRVNNYYKIGLRYKNAGKSNEAREMFQKYIDSYDDSHGEFNTSRRIYDRQDGRSFRITYGPSLEERFKDLSKAYEELALLSSPQDARFFWKQLERKNLPLERSIFVLEQLIENDRKIIEEDFDYKKYKQKKLAQKLDLKNIKESGKKLEEILNFYRQNLKSIYRR